MSLDPSTVGKKEGVDVKRQRLEIEKQRFELEKAKAEREDRFINRHLGAVLTAVIAFFAALVSLTQVWTTNITKDKEIQIANIQKQVENQRIEKEKEQEFNLNRAKFVMENNKTLFGGSPKELKRMAMIIGLLFSPEDADRMYEDLRTSADTIEAERIWSRARETIKRSIKTNDSGHLDSEETSSNRLNEVRKNGSLTGTIFAPSTDTDNPSPVEGVKIIVTDTAGKLIFNGLTDAKGIFVTEPLRPGIYNIEAQHASYLSEPGKVVIRPNLISSITIQLKRK